MTDRSSLYSGIGESELLCPNVQCEFVGVGPESGCQIQLQYSTLECTVSYATISSMVYCVLFDVNVVLSRVPYGV